MSSSMSSVVVDPAPLRPSAASAASSPLMLCDSLISLAKEADRAGFSMTAHHLVNLVHSMFDEIRPRYLT